jgi:hypothetical protein
MSDISGWSSGPYGASSWGGTAYVRDVTETAAASELLSTQALFASAIAEGASIAEILDSSGNNFIAAIIEAGAGAELVRSGPIYLDSILEASTGAEQFLSGYTVGGSIIELGTAAESVSSIYSVGASVAEVSNLTAGSLGGLPFDALISTIGWSKGGYNFGPWGFSNSGVKVADIVDSSGNNFTAAVVEDSTGAEFVNSNLTSLRSISEASTGAEQFLGSYSVNNLIIELSTGEDLTSSLYLLGGPVLEASNLTAGWRGGFPFDALISTVGWSKGDYGFGAWNFGNGGVKVADSPSSTPELGTLVLETALTQTEISALYDVNSLIQEIVQGADTVSSFIQLGNVVSEAAQAADLIASIYEPGGLVTETAQLADLTFGGVLFGSAIVELATGFAEEISVLVILVPASIVESATGTDLISATTTLNIFVSEGVTASEQNIAVAIFSSNISEIADMADEISLRLLWEIINTADDVTWNVTPTSN